MKPTNFKLVSISVVVLLIALTISHITAANVSPTTAIPSSNQVQIQIGAGETQNAIHEIEYFVNNQKVSYVNVNDEVSVKVVVSVASDGRYSIALQINDRDKIPIIYDLSAGTWECGVWSWTETGPEGTYTAKVWLNYYTAGSWSNVAYKEFTYQVGAPTSPTPSPTTPATTPTWQELVEQYWWVIVVIVILAVVVALIYATQRKPQAETGIVVVRP